MSIEQGGMPMPTQDYVMPAVDTADQGMNSKWMVRTRQAAGVVIVGGIAAVGAYFGIGGEAPEQVIPMDQTSEITGHPCNTIVKICQEPTPENPVPTDRIKVTTTESTVPSSTTTTEASTTTTTEASTTTTTEASTTTTRPGSTTTTEGPHETVPGVDTTNVPTSEVVTG